MIVSMEKVRIIGRRPRLAAVLETVQDVGVLHLCPAEPRDGVQPLRDDAVASRHLGHLRAAVDDVETALAGLGGAPPGLPEQPAAVRALPLHVRRARRVRRAVEHLEADAARQEEERTRLLRLEHALGLFAGAPGPGPGAGWRTLLLVLTGEGGDAQRIAEALREWVGDAFATREEVLPSGETALAISLPEARAEEVEARLAEEGVGELAVPPGLGAGSLSEVRTAVEERLETCERAREELRARRARLREEALPALRRARHAIHDALRTLEARTQAAGSEHLFVLEGWLPSRTLPALTARLRDEEGPPLVVERVARESWAREDVPVELSNPRLFRPFEVVTRMMPLPHYGTIDPTPFVAVFFPMFFGLMLGDVGYGAVLGLVALGLHRLSEPRGRLRALAWM
ncbi:MAG: V-type ATPase 116kDa subunit family protein, partial [Myxococcota bacterium]|nr:V-type ATPase 116kDa subunit family protein [Myxococcota bacterium]